MPVFLRKTSTAICPRPLTLVVSLLLGGAVLPVLAASENTQSADTTLPAKGNKKDDVITVQAAKPVGFQGGGDSLVPAYLDGQIANGGRVGFLGQQDARNVPFNVIGYTDKMVADQQAYTLADVVHNDATIQNVQGYGNFAESYRIRGFALDGDDITLGGLPGVMPRQVIATNMIDRIEVFKGANALVNGAALTGAGGMMNVEPKHADDEPLTRVGVDYTSSSQVGGSLDVGRRFGDNNQFGVRVNLLNREGDTAVDNEKRRVSAASIGLDYRGDSLRTSLDFGYQYETYHGGRTGVNISSVDFIPELPGNSTNYSQKWVYSDLRSHYGMWRAEYDVAHDWTVYGGIGGNHGDEMGAYSSPALTSSNGNASVGRMDVRYVTDSVGGMAGLRGKLETGFVSHSLNFNYSAMERRAQSAYSMALVSGSNNIYSPYDITSPELNYSGGDLNSPGVVSRVQTSSFALVDTMGVLDDKLLLTVGARHQHIRERNYNYGSATEITSDRFDQTSWTPGYGLLVKPWDHISLYANYMQALQPGDTAPSTALNSGQLTGIVRTTQKELGVKFDYQRVGGSLALFQINKPTGMVDSNGYYGLYGDQRNRGVELNVFGEPILGLRLNGSTALMDPKMTKTTDGEYDGKDAVGVARYTMSLGAEYDIQPVDGLTATATLTHVGPQYADAANTKRLDSYNTLDVGARYRTTLNNTQYVWRAAVMNVTNEKYWSGVDDSGTYIYQGEPRTLKLSLTMDF
jgi:iron complex outermembrane receptor protein